MLTATRLTDDQLRRAWDAWHERRDPDARADLIEHYSHTLVRPIALRMARSAGMPIADDMHQDGAIGLIDAINRADPATPGTFNSWAGTRIRGAIIDAQRNIDWVPRSTRIVGAAAVHAEDQLTRDLGRTPTREELEQRARTHLRTATARVALDLRGATQVVPLDDLDIDGSSTRAAIDVTQDPESTMIVDDVATRLAAAIAQLDPKLKAVAALIYTTDMTLTQVGETLGVSPSRAVQLQGQLMAELGAVITGRPRPTPPPRGSRSAGTAAAARKLVALVQKHATVGTRHRGRPYATWAGCVFGSCIIDRPGRQAALDHALAKGWLERDDRGRICPPGMAVHADARKVADSIARHATTQPRWHRPFRGCRAGCIRDGIGRGWTPQRRDAAVTYAISQGWLIRDPIGRLLPGGHPPDHHIDEWLAERCVLQPGSRTWSSILQADYRAWCATNSIRPAWGHDFAAWLRLRGATLRAGSTVRSLWLDIALQDTP